MPAKLSRLRILAAAAIAFAPLSVVVDGPAAQAAPCAGAGSNPVSCQHCMFYVNAYHTANVCNEDRRGVQGPPSNAPTRPPEVPVPAYEPPPIPVPVQSPLVLPPPNAGQGLSPYTHLRAHETVLDLVCRLLLEKKK
ncbi:hypothetical protein PICSAR180_04537 [Mycobacterium avium subsp. paratuberculosis]|nr:hypothetical protein PICSAR180_04537 [Mycobacterium avium subsp. paratuberculosis]